MPLNKSALDSRGYREILTTSVIIVASALTILYPDTIPLAAYIVQPGVSALRDSSIFATRLMVNVVIWGILSYILIRISERLRHKGR